MPKTDTKDEAEAKRRAEWLHKHKAPKNWIILTIEEVREVKREMDELRKECEKWREVFSQMS